MLNCGQAQVWTAEARTIPDLVIPEHFLEMAIFRAEASLD